MSRLGTVVLAVVAVAAVGVFAVRFAAPAVLGLTAIEITTPSMGEALPPGSAALVEPGDRYAVGDVITFVRDGQAITHRVTTVVGVTGGDWYRVRGDANNADDEQPVRPASIVGRVVWSAPYLGVASRLLGQPVVVVFVLTVAVAILCWPSLARPTEVDQWEAAVAKRGGSR